MVPYEKGCKGLGENAIQHLGQCFDGRSREGDAFKLIQGTEAVKHAWFTSSVIISDELRRLKQAEEEMSYHDESDAIEDEWNDVDEKFI